MSGFLRWIARGGLLVLLLQLCVVVDANAYQRGLAAGRAERSGSGPAGPGTGMGGSPAIPGFASPGLASPGLFTPVPATPVAAAKSKPTATPATPASVTGIGPDSADALERGGTQWALRKTLLRKIAMGTSNCLKQGQAGWKVFCRGVAALLVDGEKSELLKCEDMSEALMHETSEHVNQALDFAPADEIALMMDEENQNCRKFYGRFKNEQFSWARAMGYGVHQRDSKNHTVQGTMSKVAAEFTKLKEHLHEFAPAKLIIRDNKGRKVGDGIEVTKYEDLIRALVMYYDFDPSSGQPFRVCIKFDGTDIMGGRKCERVVLCVMTQLTDGSYECLQSPDDCLCVAAWDINTEDWHYLQQGTVKLRQAVTALEGKTIETPNGPVQIEFHCAADMKSLWIALGVSLSTKELRRCFCCEEAVQGPFKNLASWVWRKATKNFWGLPLDRYHFCALHMEMRIPEKLDFLLRKYMATKNGAAHTCNDMGIRNAAEKTDAQLKTAGLFESETRIRKYITALRDPETVNMPHASFNFDMKRGGKNGTVPQTLCLTAAHARALTANFKKVLLAVDINTAKQGAEKYSMRELVYNTWEAWANVSVFLHSTKADGTRFTYENRAEDAKAFGVAAREFGYWFVLAYGTGEITPYIHLLVEHGEWYWAKYGPYSYWNCQGLERSNSVFKRRLTGGTQMGGGRTGLGRYGAFEEALEIEYRKFGRKEVRARRKSRHTQWVGKLGKNFAYNESSNRLVRGKGFTKTPRKSVKPNCKPVRMEIDGGVERAVEEQQQTQ